MGYPTRITSRMMTLYKMHFTMIKEIPSGRSQTFPFSSEKQMSEFRHEFYSWRKVNGYEGFYSGEAIDEGLSFKVTNLRPVGNNFPSPVALQGYLEALPSELWFEAVLHFLTTFNLYPKEEIDKLIWNSHEPAYQPPPKPTRPERDEWGIEIVYEDEDTDTQPSPKEVSQP